MEKKDIEVIEVKNMPARAIQFALDNKADIEDIEKLLTLQERWEANEARKEYHVAMADFKANAPMLKKDKKVGYKTDKGSVGYAYASLFNITKNISAELSKHGLSASWYTKQNGAIIVTCKITHIKGHFEEVTLSAPADTSGAKNTIQAIGSTVAYLERYTLLAATGLAAEDMDDDGQKAATEYIDEKQKSTLVDMLSDKGVSLEKFCSKFNVKELAELPKAKYQQAILAIGAVKRAK